VWQFAATPRHSNSSTFFNYSHLLICRACGWKHPRAPSVLLLPISPTGIWSVIETQQIYLNLSQADIPGGPCGNSSPSNSSTLQLLQLLPHFLICRICREAPSVRLLFEEKAIRALLHSCGGRRSRAASAFPTLVHPNSS